MDRGLYISATGMMAQEAMEKSVTMNVAHAGTTGFRGETVALRTFQDELANMMVTDKGTAAGNNIGMGVSVDDIMTIQSPGQIHFTDNNLDMAIDGDGFFVIGTPQGDMYTRSGTFRLDSEGILRTLSGYTVKGEQGEITITDKHFEVSDTGEIIENGVVTDQLLIRSFANPERLERSGDVTFSAADQAGYQPTNFKVMQRFLEDSNVNIFNEMVNMITITRSYEMNQRIIQSIDGNLEQAIRDVGSV